MDDKIHYGCLGIPSCSHPAKEPCDCPCHKAMENMNPPTDMMNIGETVERLITERLNNMPHYEEYMVNSTMKVLAVNDITAFIQSEISKAKEEGYVERGTINGTLLSEAIKQAKREERERIKAVIEGKAKFVAEYSWKGNTANKSYNEALADILASLEEDKGEV